MIKGSLSVSLSVMQLCCANMAERIQVQSEVENQNTVIDGVLILPCGCGGELMRPSTNYSAACWEAGMSLESTGQVHRIKVTEPTPRLRQQKRKRKCFGWKSVSSTEILQLQLVKLVLDQWFLTFFTAGIPWTRPTSSGTPKSKLKKYALRNKV